MTPLSDALTAAQRSALAALEKAYVAGKIFADVFEEELAKAGISDPVDVAFLVASLDVLREWGVSAPTMTERVAAENEPASDKQLAFIAKLYDEKHIDETARHNKPLTKANASQIITELTSEPSAYDASKWTVPFCPRCEYDLTGSDPERDERDARMGAGATESDVERTKRCLPS